MTPELRARTKIDQQLVEAGWLVQHKDEFNRNAGVGVAVREFSLPPGPCDYLLFVGGKAAGVIEAKPAGTTLSGVAEQAGKYMERLPEHLARWADTLLFDYESTGEETLFRDVRDPDARSRRLFTVHRPETLLRWAQAGDTLRLRLRQMPPLDTAAAVPIIRRLLEDTPAVRRPNPFTLARTLDGTLDVYRELVSIHS